MSDSPPTQDHSNDMQRTEYYSLHDLEGFSQEMKHIHRVDDHLVQSVLRAGSVLSELDKETPRAKALLRHRLFQRDFRDTDRFNMSILDSRANSYENHKIMAALSERCLTPSVKYTLDGGIRTMGRVWVIHIFCYDLPTKRLNPLTLSVILLGSILVQVSTRQSTKHQDWGSFEVTHEPIRTENSTMRDYQRTMEVLQALIYQILEKCPGNTMHFIFTGINCRGLGHQSLNHLACFIIDMARLVRAILPNHMQDNRMVKCVFCGDGLLDLSCLLDYLFQHKERLEKGSEEEQDEVQKLFAKILMLEWNIHEEDRWDEQDLECHYIDPEKVKEKKYARKAKEEKKAKKRRERNVSRATERT